MIPSTIKLEVTSPECCLASIQIAFLSTLLSELVSSKRLTSLPPSVRSRLLTLILLVMLICARVLERKVQRLEKV